MIIRRLLLIVTSVCACLPVCAQEATNRFSIRVGQGVLTGTEEYTIAKTSTGYVLRGTIRIRRMGVEQELRHETSLDEQRNLVSYRLDVSAGGRSQTLEARRTGADVVLTATGQTQPKSIPLAANMVILDNLVPSHYQLLLDRTSTAQGSVPESWSALVPQAFAAITGKLSVGGIEKATLDKTDCEVRKYTMELANVLIEFWADTRTNRLMRVTVPIQDVEIVREGFSPATPPSQPASQSGERELTFPSGDLAFPATLSLPANASGRVPLVVLVHGSGPHDRDETIGPNKPFRDIANGLARAGIATLRYDKRTFAFKAKLDVKSMTIEQETVDDAVAALKYAGTLPEVDPGRLFLLGHSLGATAAPLVAARFPDLKGVILMAGTVRPLDELIYEQTAHAMEIAGTPSAESRTKVDELKAAFGRVRSGEASDDEMVFFAPARYWRDLFRRDFAAELSRTRVPVLVLQGGKDIQVTRTDYDLVGKALASRPPDRRESHWFPDLNHLMMRVEGESTGAEYGRASTVAPEVVEAIATWIKRR